ncbi:hypothetical protein BBF96_12850 [Anoxybacter fermentans]|uniref:Transport permease protein n=1 Tax=Anoxybacter fermentans TaxID=1323375 RepID=A0A3S9T0W3_9FIRM|nr:ABC transporter permease [Anoxybacter fermentans]AZR74208.1 hypothetical protein BBF96_12850 [Anoxybacter fermentans]
MKLVKFLKETWYITSIFLRTLRFYGLFTYVLSIFFPIAMLGFLKLLYGPFSVKKAYFIIAGNIVMSIVSICVTTLGQVITNMKRDNAIEFYAALPIINLSIIMGISLAYLIINFPSFIVVLFAGMIIFQVKIIPHIGLVLFIIATAWSLSGIGAIIGTYSKNIQAGTILSLVIGFSFYMLAPVYFSREAFPIYIRWITWFIPSTYSAEGVRATLFGYFTMREFFNLLVLILFGVVLNILVLRKFQFRKKGYLKR